MSDATLPRILLLSTNSDQAGAPLHVEVLLRSLSNEFSFISYFGSDGPVYRRLKDDGHDVRLLLGMRSSFNAIADMVLLVKLIAIIKKVRPNIIHCHSSKAGMLGRIAGRICGVPVVFTIHGWSWMALNGLKAKIAIWLERRVAQIAGAHYVYVCREMAKERARVIGIEGRSEIVIYNGIRDLSSPNANEYTDVSILMPARVSRQKDHETVVRAFDSLPLGSCKLTLCGSGTETSEFAASLRQWAPLRHQEIECLGQRSDMQHLYNCAQVMVLSSRWEAFPLSTLEAMSASLPVVAADVGGVREQISDGETGLLVPPGDVEAMQIALARLLCPSERKRIGEAGRKNYESNFTLEHMVKNTLEYYRGILTGTRDGDEVSCENIN